MTTANVVNNRNNNNYNYEADRSGDSQTALLLEHERHRASNIDATQFKLEKIERIISKGHQFRPDDDSRIFDYNVAKLPAHRGRY
jgi:hypothetical protein